MESGEERGSHSPRWLAVRAPHSTRAGCPARRLPARLLLARPWCLARRFAPGLGSGCGSGASAAWWFDATTMDPPRAWRQIWRCPYIHAPREPVLPHGEHDRDGHCLAHPALLPRALEFLVDRAHVALPAIRDFLGGEPLGKETQVLLLTRRQRIDRVGPRRHGMMQGGAPSARAISTREDEEGRLEQNRRRLPSAK